MDSSANTEIDSTGTNGVQASQYINPGNKISTVKLTDENFLLWKFQVLTTLEGHGLESYIECDDDPPPKLIQVSAESSSSTKLKSCFYLVETSR